MPYSLKEKQREYQRKWAASRRQVVGGRVTYEQLIGSRHITSLKKWEDCVSDAKELVKTQRGNRLSIAALAQRACIIRHGGDFKTETYRQLYSNSTVKAFSKEIGIHPKTLSNWIAVKTNIYDNLTSAEKKAGVRWRDANYALKTANGKGAVACYRKYEKAKNRKALLAAVYGNRLSGLARFFVENPPKKILTPSDFKKAKGGIERLCGIFGVTLARR